MSLFDWFRRDHPGPRVAALEPDQAGHVAAVHAASFARGWGTPEFERLLAERGVVADGLFLEGRSAPDGVVLSRVVLDDAEILTVAIAPAARGRGLGRTLLEPHLDALARAGARQVYLEVEKGNAPAIALYRRLGFREMGRREAYYTKAGAPAATAITMRLDL